MNLKVKARVRFVKLLRSLFERLTKWQVEEMDQRHIVTDYVLQNEDLTNYHYQKLFMICVRI